MSNNKMSNNKMRTKKKPLPIDMTEALALLLLLLSWCPTAIAAVGDPTLQNDTSRVADLDEVVVVAQPKETARLRLQPLASSVFGNGELARFGVRDLRDLSSFVPSFAMPAYGSRLTSSVYMRGTGSRINAAAPSVPVYYDNIPIVSKSAFNHHFYMLDRVDVLRGPQATLYGMNSEGGLVRIYSKNPMNYQGTDVNLGAGSAFWRKAEVAHYHRPSEQLAFMVAGFYCGQNGFFKNTHLGERNDEADEVGAKLRLMWKPLDRLTFDLTSDYQFTLQTAFPYGVYDTAKEETADPSTTFTNSYRRQMVSTGLSLSFDLSDNLLFTSATSHQYLWDRMKMDQDYVPGDYMRLEQVQKMQALTQELVVRSKGNGSWRHTTGVFGSYEWLSTQAPVVFGDEMELFIKQQWKNMPSFVRDGLKFRNNWVPGSFHTPQANLGLYHESAIALTSRLKATVGLRYDYSRVAIDYDTRSMFDVDINVMGFRASHAYLSAFASSKHETFHQLLPKIGLTLQTGSQGSNVYAVVSKGYRAGGYNLQMFSDIFQSEQRTMGSMLMTLMSQDLEMTHTAEDIDRVNSTITYKPEVSWNYEAGAHLNLFDHKLQADIALYYNQIRNQQLSVMAGQYGYGRAMVNAGQSYSCGAEVALRGSALDDRLLWGATYSYTHSVFKEYDDSVSVTTEQGSHNEYVSYKGNRVPFIPIHSFSAHADYRFDLGGHGWLHNITVGANVQGRGKTYWEADNRLCQKFYAILGAHLALDMGKVVVDLWGRNLTGTKYNTFLVNSKLTNQNFAQRGMPLQAGIDVRVHI
jgi:outer membrane receptor protein involved in Fe transport